LPVTVLRAEKSEKVPPTSTPMIQSGIVPHKVLMVISEYKMDTESQDFT